MKVTIGRYLNGNTIIHRLDSRVKLFGTISFIVLLFIANTFFMQFLLLSILIIAFILTTKKPIKLISTTKMPLWIGFFLFIINMFLIGDQNNDVIYWQFEGLAKISQAVIIQTSNVILRIYSIMLCINILTLSTKPVLLAKALKFYLYPLKFLKIPIDIFVTIITISLRFIPTILDEAGRILKAQASRGVDFKNGNIKSKSKSMIVLIVPLFVSSFAKADDLANAMETRGYDPYGKSTSYRKWNITWFDFVSLFMIVAIIAIYSCQLAGVIEVPYWFISTREGLWNNIQPLNYIWFWQPEFWNR